MSERQGAPRVEYRHRHQAHCGWRHEQAAHARLAATERHTSLIDAIHALEPHLSNGGPR